MIHTLKLRQFKNFEAAELICGPLTLLIGTNASGKSNVRDAFRFLHGIGRGYRLAEIVGGKYGPGSELVWDGIRGGVREIAYRGASTFSLEVTVEGIPDSESPSCIYTIEVALNYDDGQLRIASESLYWGQHQVFKAEPISNSSDNLAVRVLGKLPTDSQLQHHAGQPALTQITRPFFSALSIRNHSNYELLNQFEIIRPRFINALGRMRFLEPSLNAMRQPSTSGQLPLGDHGEHLASVLQAICIDPSRKTGLLSWLRSLTPMDVADLRFPPDFTGKVLLMLVEQNGQEISAYSASGGTLRLLAMLAALLGPQSEQLFFFEELENGIHPARLHVLIDLIESQVTHHHTQVVTTTHSPQLLRLVNSETLKHTSLIYRLEDQAEGHICQLTELPEPAQQVLQTKDLAYLYESGWFENAISFLAAEEEA